MPTFGQDFSRILKLHDEDQNEIEALKAQLIRDKRFQGMVIHDMRNPTVAIKMGLEQTQRNLNEALHLLQIEQAVFQSRCASLLELMNQKQLSDGESRSLARNVEHQLDQMQAKILPLKKVLVSKRSQSGNKIVQNFEESKAVDPLQGVNYDASVFDEGRPAPQNDQIISA